MQKQASRRLPGLGERREAFKALATFHTDVLE